MTISCRVLLASRTALPERVDEVGARHVVVEARKSGNGHRARHLTRGVTAHPVSDGEQSRARVRRILVSLPQEPDVRADRVSECKCHLRSSRTVLPILIGTPTGTGVGRVTF